MALLNVTETLARMLFDETLASAGKVVCDCPRCRDDILAYALNRLPAHYVTSDLGEAYVKAQFLNSQMQLDLLRELTIAADVVGKHPRHDAADNVPVDDLMLPEQRWQNEAGEA
ncbi:MAG: late competence development ComFB family protein [Alicyclobacillus herbarius]|uniref:late competence development ComFB family protein n=1 Tax=Alicyclobacillus herbarius TaxID=122960 RepID=UPI002352899C|nr:late competence development ComFB family protein [Alicyclobacillus herbarius]MCL6633625.1 late competence development ComFB family protein [Alicyclobacillus herbarius]